MSGCTGGRFSKMDKKVVQDRAVTRCVRSTVANKMGRLVSAAALIACGFGATASAQAGGNPGWSDEFHPTEAGVAPDASKWTYDIGGSGWGNHELEYYTNRPENARIEDGKLGITARQETYTGT